MSRPKGESALRILRERDVARLLLGSFISTLANAAQAVALGWLVYDISGRKLDLGLLGLAEFAPAAVLALVSGHLADRFDRRRIAAIALVAESGVALAIAVYAASNPRSTAPIYALAVAFGTARSFQAPATRALLPSVAPPHLLSDAVALSSTTWQASIIVGPALGGLLYRFGPEMVFASSAVLFLLTAGMYLTVRPREVRAVSGAGGETRAGWRTAVEGLALIRRHPLLLGAISLDLFAVLLGGAVALVPVFAKDVLDVGVEGAGYLRAAGGVGAAVTGLALAARPIRRHVGTALFVAVAVFGVATIVFGTSKNFWLSMAAMAVLNGADMVSVYVRATLVPLVTPDALRGRVMAVENVFIGASNELGAFESGVAAQAIGAVPAVVLGGVGTLAIVGVWSVLFPALRRVDRFDDASAEAKRIEASLLAEPLSVTNS